MKVFGKRDLASQPPPDHEIEVWHASPSSLSRSPGPVQSALRERVLKEIDSTAAANLSSDVLRRHVEEIIHEIANEDRLELSGSEQTRLAEDLTNDMTGYGPLQALLADDGVDDIMVNGPASIYVERRGKIEQADLRFRDVEHIAAVAQKIVARVGRRIDEASPMVDARLPDGSRVNVIFPPLAIDSPCISIRKFPKHRFELAAMVQNGSLTAGVARLLEIAARCRLNMLISGGTGSGKTTMLNAISRSIGRTERIITIEDAAELQMQQPHVIRLETRPPSLEGTGQVTQRDLVWNALRMRPDRIIVGEVRGAEAFDMLQAMNTGHDGSISTIHANSARDALTRVENMVQMGHVNLPARAIRNQIVGALDLIVHLERMRDGTRRVTQVTEVCGMEGEVITTNDIAAFVFSHEDPQGLIVGHYDSPHALPAFLNRLAYFGLDRLWAEAAREI
jgi:pilus assembly protein CpaF